MLSYPMIQVATWTSILLTSFVSSLPARQYDQEILIAYDACRSQAYSLECRCYQVDIIHLEDCTGLTSLHLSDMSKCLRLTTGLEVLCRTPKSAFNCRHVDMSLKCKEVSLCRTSRSAVNCNFPESPPAGMSCRHVTRAAWSICC